MRGARVQYQNPMISYCKTAPDQICRRAPNGRPCQAISRQKSAGRRQIWSGARLRAAEPPAGKVIPDFAALSWIDEVCSYGMFKVYLDDVVGRHSIFQKMGFEYVEKQIALAATSDAGKNLDKAVVFSLDEAVKKVISSDCH